jgi:hypothetical protein
MRDEFGAWARGTTFLSPNYQLRRMPTVIASALTTAFPALNVAIAGTAITYATVAAYAIYTAGTMWALKQLAPKAPTPTSPDLSNRLQPDSPKQVIYGRTRVGGAITYIESVDNNSNLLQVICIAGHPVEEIEDIYVNDTRVAKANVGSGSVLGGDVDHVDWKDGSTKVVKVFKGNGSNNTSALASLYVLTDNSTDVNSTDFTGNGTSFLFTNFEYSKKVFTNGIPTINAVVKGRKIYDPRKDSTSDAYDSSLGVSTHRKTTESTWEYSNNPALCILDYLTQEHGLNVDYDEIDDVEWATEADICEEQVTEYSEGQDVWINDRYNLNGVFTRDMAPQEIIPAMLSSCAGSLFYAQGKWVLRVGEYRTPISPVFDESDLRGPISVDTKTSRRDLYNSVTGKVSAEYDFTDPNTTGLIDFIPTDYPMVTSSVLETEDGGVRNTLELPLPFTADLLQAQRIAKQTLFRSREQIVVNARFGLKAFQARVGDNIKLTNSRMGWNQKVFEVVSWKFAYGEGAALEVDLTLKENSSDAYDWNAEASVFSANNTTLPRYNYAPQPSFDGTPTTEIIIQSDGTTTANAEVAWTVTDAKYVNDYVLEWKRTSETNYQSLITTNLYARITGVEVGETYDLRISSRNRLGIQSDLSTTTVTIAADTTAPSAPTGVSGSGGFRSNFISWVNPTDNDFKEVQVYVNTSNTTSGATLLGSTAATEFVHGGLPESTTRYYFLKALDFTGNASGFSAGTGAVTTQADPQDGTNGTNGTNGAAGDNGDTVATGRVYYQTLQSSSPSSPSASSFNFSTGILTGLSSGWSQTQPAVDITDTSVYEWSAPFTATKDGTTSAITVSFGSVTSAIQVTTDIESDNYVSGVSGWQIQRDTGNAEFGAASIRGTLSANQVQIDNVTLDTDGSGNLIIKTGGVDTSQIAAAAVSSSDRYYNPPSSSYASSSGTWGATIWSQTISANSGDKFYISTETPNFNLSSWIANTYYLQMYTFLNNASFSAMTLHYPNTTNYYGGIHYGGVFTATATGNLTLDVRFKTSNTTANSAQANGVRINVLKLER